MGDDSRDLQRHALDLRKAWPEYYHQITKFRQA